MPKINILPPEVFNLISAGEVVERPSAVVKELVENSIDAGASEIVVSIVDGGKSNITVIDNGCGIEKESLPLAFFPHATSKLSRAEDLDDISTLGFRGEALPSINAVAQVKISSRTAECEVGSYFDAQTKTCGELGMVCGTKIEVNNLFYNAPVRAKFLKKAATEAEFVSDIVSQIIFANPNVKIKYVVDGKTVFQTLGGMENALYAVYSSEIANNMLAFDYQFEKIRVYGYCGNKELYKHNKNFQTIIVNGRPINNVTIQMAVAQAYGNILMKRCYPVFVLNIIMPFDEVDVNVHPRKSEVRFVDNNAIFSCVYRSIKRVLEENEKSIGSLDNTLAGQPTIVEKLDMRANNYKNSLNMEQKELGINEKLSTLSTEAKDSLSNLYMKFNNLVENSSANSSENLTFTTNDNKSANLSDNLTNKSGQKIQIDLEEYSNIVPDSQCKFGSKIPNVAENRVNFDYNNFNKESENVDKYSNKNIENNDIFDKIEQICAEFRIIGQLFNTYLIVEQADKMYLIDQHACHERILYDKLIKQINASDVISQPMLLPYIYECDHQKFEFLLSIVPNLNKLGFEIEEFGGFSFKINAIPSILGNIDFQNFFDGLFQDKQSLLLVNKNELINDKLASQACKAAIKGGDNLTESQIASLLTNGEIPTQCPHGRPVVKVILKTDIEKLFKRIV
ncbi:MAG: DNA mismatch repair endonuclease MutL [Clostridia bacterium]